MNSADILDGIEKVLTPEHLVPFKIARHIARFQGAETADSVRMNLSMNAFMSAKALPDFDPAVKNDISSYFVSLGTFDIVHQASQPGKTMLVLSAFQDIITRHVAATKKHNTIRSGFEHILMCSKNKRLYEVLIKEYVKRHSSEEPSRLWDSLATEYENRHHLEKAQGTDNSHEKAEMYENSRFILRLSKVRSTIDPAHVRLFDMYVGNQTLNPRRCVGSLLSSLSFEKTLAIAADTQNPMSEKFLRYVEELNIPSPNARGMTVEEYQARMKAASDLHNANVAHINSSISTLLSFNSISPGGEDA